MAYFSYKLPYYGEFGDEPVGDPFKGLTLPELISRGFTEDTAQQYIQRGYDWQDLTNAIQRRLQLFPDLKPRTHEEEFAYLENLGLDPQSARNLALGGYRNPELIQALDEVRAQFDPQERNLRQLNEQLANRYSVMTGAYQGYQQKYDTALQQIYADLQNRLKEQQGNEQAALSQQQQAVGQTYDQAQQAQQQAGQTMSDIIRQRAAQLGVSAAVPDATTQLQQRLATEQAQGAEQKASNVAALQTYAGKAASLGQQALGTAEKTLSVQRAGLVSQITDVLGQIGIETTQAQTQIANQLADLKNQRGAAIRKAYQDILTAKSEAERQDRLDKLAEQIQLGTLEIQQGRLGLDVRKQEFYETNEQWKRGLEQARLEMDDAHFQAELEQKKRQIDVDEAKGIISAAEADARRKYLEAQTWEIYNKQGKADYKPKPDDYYAWWNQQGQFPNDQEKALFNEAFQYVINQVGFGENPRERAIQLVRDWSDWHSGSGPAQNTNPPAYSGPPIPAPSPPGPGLGGTIPSSIGPGSAPSSVGGSQEPVNYQDKLMRYLVNNMEKFLSALRYYYGG